VKTNSKIDLIYKAVCAGGKRMGFDIFLDSLVKVAELLFHEVVDDSGAALRAFLDHHLLPLFLKLQSQQESVSQMAFDSLIEMHLREVSSTLLLIYQVYFKGSELISNSEASVSG